MKGFGYLYMDWKWLFGEVFCFIWMVSREELLCFMYGMGVLVVFLIEGCGYLLRVWFMGIVVRWRLDLVLDV